MPTCGLGRHGSVTVRRQTRALVEPIFRGLDAEDVYRDLSQSRIRSIDALNAIVERYELAARFAGRMLAREGSASPAHLKVAVHAIIGNLHQYPAETRGYERACTSPDSPLPAALKAFEAVDFDSARALQLELVVHFMRCYSGMSLSPYIIRTVDDCVKHLQNTPADSAHPQARAAGMRVVREYIMYYLRNRSYLPGSHGVAAVVAQYAAMPHASPHVAARVVDIFFMTDLPGRSAGDPREFIELDCAAIARQAALLIERFPEPPDRLLLQMYGAEKAATIVALRRAESSERGASSDLSPMLVADALVDTADGAPRDAATSSFFLAAEPGVAEPPARKTPRPPVRYADVPPPMHGSIASYTDSLSHVVVPPFHGSIQSEAADMHHERGAAAAAAPPPPAPPCAPAVAAASSMASASDFERTESMVQRLPLTPQPRNSAYSAPPQSAPAFMDVRDAWSVTPVSSYGLEGGGARAAPEPPRPTAGALPAITTAVAALPPITTAASPPEEVHSPALSRLEGCSTVSPAAAPHAATASASAQFETLLPPDDTWESAVLAVPQHCLNSDPSSPVTDASQQRRVSEAELACALAPLRPPESDDVYSSPGDNETLPMPDTHRARPELDVGATTARGAITDRLMLEPESLCSGRRLRSSGGGGGGMAVGTTWEDASASDMQALESYIAGIDSCVRGSETASALAGATAELPGGEGTMDTFKTAHSDPRAAPALPPPPPALVGEGDAPASVSTVPPVVIAETLAAQARYDAQPASVSAVPPVVIAETLAAQWAAEVPPAGGTPPRHAPHTTASATPKAPPQGYELSPLSSCMSRPAGTPLAATAAARELEAFPVTPSPVSSRMSYPMPPPPLDGAAMGGAPMPLPSGAHGVHCGGDGGGVPVEPSTIDALPSVPAVGAPHGGRAAAAPVPPHLADPGALVRGERAAAAAAAKKHTKESLLATVSSGISAHSRPELPAGDKQSPQGRRALPGKLWLALRRAQRAFRPSRRTQLHAVSARDIHAV